MASLFQTVGQRLRGLSLLARHGRPDHVLGCDIGVGDEVMLTAVVHALRERNASARVWVLARRPELFEGIALALPHDGPTIEMLYRSGLPLSFINYTAYDSKTDSDARPPAHFIAIMGQKLGLRGSLAMAPHLILTDEEKLAAEEHRGAIVIQSTCVRGQGTMLNKEWGPQNFQAVVDLLSPRHRVVQIGLDSDPVLAGATHLQGKLTLRQTAAILTNAGAFIGLASGLMHLARSVDCRSVIIYGGREEPEKSGYSCNENLVKTPPCSPCWVRNRCAIDRVCLSDIKPSDVAGALERLLNRSVRPVEIDRTELPF